MSNTTTKVQEARRERLRALADYYGVDESTTAHEDLKPYLDGEGEIAAFAAVTRGHFTAYIYPYCDTAEQAQDRAEHNIATDTVPEYPVAVVNLDTGETWDPGVPEYAWAKIASA
jgi:hypothetical protein